MKREQIINKIYDKIRYDLLHANLLYWEEDDTNKYPLVDHLSSGNDISTGRDEIDNLIEQIEIEPLIDAIIALPLDVPSDKESQNHTSKAMIDKLVEEIANDFLDFEGLEIPKDGIPIICRAMQAYHEAKMKEVTDKDIEAYLDAHKVDDKILRGALRIGAKAMRDGVIKHIKK